MGAWIEIVQQEYKLTGFMSHPTMGAWIEIMILMVLQVATYVAPHDGCVD